MQFFLYEIAFRIAALAACVWCGRRVWYGAVERKITLHNTDWLDWWTPDLVFQRDAMPVRYWMTLCMTAVTTVSCFLAAIVGYWQPNT